MAVPAKSAPPVSKPVEAVKPPEPVPAPPTVMVSHPPAPVPPPAPVEQGIHFGQYLLLEKIATGGMAELFKAKRKGVEGFEKILAIKKILPHMSDNEEFITMFIDEAKLAAQLTHHNICQIFDLGKIESSYYIAMEYIHGKDLRAVLKAARSKDRPVPVELAILITSKVCSALDYAHRKKEANGQPLNLVHRDVSPQNILLSYEGEVKLVDFGIAKATTKVHVTQHGALKGKLLYMSPEQAWGRSVDKRTDIFSVGVVLYEMLTGRPLFFEDNDTEVTILEKVREAKIFPIRELNPKVSAELQKILEKGLKKLPEERYQVASDMQKDLDNLFYSEGYNATSANLANYVRSLFPEEWGQETGGVKETVVLDKSASEALKAAVPPEGAAPPSRGGHVGASPAGRPSPVPAEQPAPPPRRQPRPPVEEKKEERKAEPQPVPAAKIEPPVPAPEVKPSPAVPREQPQPAPFRDISAPGIMMEQPEKSNFPKIVAAIVGVAVIGLILFLLFRPKGPEKPPEEPAKKTEQPAGEQPKQEAATPATTEQKPATTEQDKQIQELKKKAEEEQKKLEQMKADEAKRKQELADQQKKEEQARLEQQQRQEQEAKKAAEQQQQQQQQAKIAEVQPPPVQEPPKQEPPKQEAPVTPPPATEQPAEPAVKEGDLVELGPEVIKPVVTQRVEAEYPPIAKRNRIEGTVILSLLVNERGQVVDVKVLRGAGGSSGLNEAAVAAARKWKFQPAVKQGKRVKVWISQPMAFRVQ